MLGIAISRIASSRGDEVLCVVRPKSKKIANLPKGKNISILEANLDSYASLDLGQGYDEFYHLAWDSTYGAERDNVLVQEKNIAFTIDAVKVAFKSGCKVFVGAGSQAEYGIAKDPLTSKTPIQPQSAYGIAKYAAGRMSGLLSEQLGMRHNWVRILSMYGNNDSPNTLIMYTIAELNAGKSPQLTRCEQIWDYVHCEDAARAILAIGKLGLPGKTYPLGSGKARRLSEYIEDIRKIIDPTIELHFGAKEYFAHQPMYLCADISELTKDTGWKPEIDFSNGIRMLIEQIKSKSSNY